MLRYKSKIMYLMISIFGLTIYGCSSAEKIESQYSRNEIKIDGIQTDWTNKLKSVKDENVVVGFQNDDNDLYICLATSTRTDIMKILMMGMTIWLKPDNDKDIIGIRYPLKHEPGEFREFRRNENEQQDNPEEMIRRTLSDQSEVEIINKDGKTIISLPINGQSGLEAKIGFSMRQLVYELKIPLKKNNNEFAFNSGNGNDIKIEFETGKFEPGELRNNNVMREPGENGEGSDQSGGDGEMPGGYGGGMGGHRGGGAGRPGNSEIRRNFTDVISFDVDLKLAKN